MKIPHVNWRLMDRFLGPAIMAVILLLIVWLGLLQPYTARETALRTLEGEWQGRDVPIWTTTSELSASQNALRHFEKHGVRLGYKTASDYVAAAHMLLHDRAADTVCGIQRDGDTACYNPRLNRFGVMNKAGAPRTFFDPDPAIHGKASNVDYFCDQVPAPCPLRNGE